MSMELYIIHLLFISACVYFSFKAGERNGRGEMIEDMLEKKLFSHSQLMKAYRINEQG